MRSVNGYKKPGRSRSASCETRTSDWVHGRNGYPQEWIKEHSGMFRKGSGGSNGSFYLDHKPFQRLI